MNPTHETYEELTRAYQHYNAELFDGKLPLCLLTLSRQHDTLGYFSANQFVNLADGKGQTCHEITLNPTYFAIRSIPENLSVMVREMVSLLQLLEGKPPRRRYRNREWADMCENIGLMPSDTGKPGGKRVGDGVQTYIIEGGPFDVASAKLIDGEFKLSWVDRFPPALPPEEAPAATDEVDYSDLAAPATASSDAASKPNPLDQLMELDEGTEPLAPDSTTEAGASATSVPSASKPVNAFKQPAEPESKDLDDAPRMKVFAHAPAAQLAELGIEPRQAAKSASKNKYSCPVKACKGNVWGKPGMRVFCGGNDKKQHDPELMVFDAATPQEQPEGDVERF